MNKLIIGLVLILVLISFGCVDSFGQNIQYCGNYCEAETGEDICIYKMSAGKMNSECSNCIHTCLLELEGAKTTTNKTLESFELKQNGAKQ